MDANRFRLQLSVRQKELDGLNVRIEQAKFVNESRKRLQAQKSELEDLVTSTRKYVESLKLLQSRAIKENDEFKTRRLNLLNTEITDNLEKVLPDKGLVADVKCDFNRKNRISVTLKDSTGEKFSPRMCNGMLVKYFTAFSGVSAIVKALGVKNLYVDEAFGASSQENLPVVGDYIQSLIEQGIQVVLVSQNDKLYRDLPRRVFNLVPKNSGRYSEIDSVVDYGMEG